MKKGLSGCMNTTQMVRLYFALNNSHVFFKKVGLDPDSRDGRYLLLRTEFHSQCDYRASTLIARRSKSDPDIPQAKMIYGISDPLSPLLIPVSLYV
jgi:hypothetical protein